MVKKPAQKETVQQLINKRDPRWPLRVLAGEKRMVAGRQPGFKPGDAKKIHRVIDACEKQIGKRNIESIYLFGGVAEHSKSQRVGRGYRDLDVYVLTKNHASAEKLESRFDTKQGILLQAYGIDLHINSLDRVLKDRNKSGSVAVFGSGLITGLLGGYPIYNREAGLATQRRIEAEFIRRLGKDRVKELKRVVKKRLETRGNKKKKD